MKAVIQRVSEASVTINGKEKRSIGKGLVVLAGISPDDTQEDLEWLSRKITGMRIFTDPEGKMNLNVQDAEGEILIISQFTLFASTKKGNRPSFNRSAVPAIAIPLFDQFTEIIGLQMNGRIKTGEFGADMAVSLINDGPVTISIDTHNKE